MQIRKLLGVTVITAALIGCEGDPVAGPDNDGPGAGISFTANGAQHTSAGVPSGEPARLLDQPFALARADSVGGFAVIGFERTGENKGNLIILQGPRLTETLVCAPFGSPCHGRYFVGLENGTPLTMERHFEVVSGSITPTQIGPDRFRGTFRITLHPSDDGPDDTIVIDDGTIDVPLVADTVGDRVMSCLLSLAGGDVESCLR